MRLIDLFEAKSGTFVGIKLSPKSKAAIMKWIDKLPNHVDKDDLHVTMILDKENPFKHKPKTFDPKILIEKPKFKIFGKDKNILVLSFESDDLTKRHMALRKKYGIEWDFPNYSPHITVAYDTTEIPDMDLPDFDIELSKEYVEPFSYNP